MKQVIIEDITPSLNQLINLTKAKIPFTDYLEGMDYSISTKTVRTTDGTVVNEILSVVIDDGPSHVLLEVSQLPGTDYGQITHLRRNNDTTVLLTNLYLRIVNKTLSEFYPDCLDSKIVAGRIELLIPAIEDNLTRLDLLRVALNANGLDLIHELSTTCKITIAKQGALR